MPGSRGLPVPESGACVREHDLNGPAEGYRFWKDRGVTSVFPVRGEVCRWKPGAWGRRGALRGVGARKYIVLPVLSDYVFMTLSRLLWGAAWAVLVAAPGLAQPTLPLALDVDYATFQYDEDEALVETYLAFEASSLPYVRAEEQFEVMLPVTVTLRRTSVAGPEQASADAVFADTLAYRFAVADTAGLVQGQYFVQQVRAAVPPGEYELEVGIPGDAATGRAAFAARRDVEVPDFGAARSADRAVLSGITLASAIGLTDDRDAPFYKNGLIVRPNPNLLFGQGLPTLFYYAEAYGLDAAMDGEAYTLFAYLSASNFAQPLEGYQQRTERQARDTDVLAGSFDLRTLPGGVYFLHLALLDANNEAVAEASRSFYVYNPGVAQPVVEAVDESYLTNLYAVMPEDELAANVRHADVIASNRERERLRRAATPELQREALAAFWRARDTVPGTPINEARREFYERLRYADDRYSNSFTEGWNTDRGQVVLKYGYPSQVTPNLYESDTLPHEIWEYDNIPGSGRAVFVFVDRDGFGGFELVHSTVTGEVSMPDWQQQLRR